MTRLAAALDRPPDPRPDGGLLAAFLGHRDEGAFAELVRRHGRLVWGVCRRTLPDPADAEDAFQATFLVLVRRAGRLTAASTVGPWLHRVAALTARTLRRKNARRLATVGALPAAVPDPRAEFADVSLDADAVLLRLPERDRAALVLCCLEGLTHREAADRLGCAEGTVSARVSRGLAKLRARFGGREPAAVLVGLLAGAVPADLAAAAVRSAAAVQLASLAAAGPVVAHLTRGVLRMFWAKKLVGVGMAAVALLGAGLGVGVTARQGPAAVAGDDKPAAKPKGDPAADELELLTAKLHQFAHDRDQAVRQAEAARVAHETRFRVYDEHLAVLQKMVDTRKTQMAGRGSPSPAAAGSGPEDDLRRAQQELEALTAQQQALAATRAAAVARVEEARARLAGPKPAVTRFTLAVYRRRVESGAPLGTYELSEYRAGGATVSTTYFGEDGPGAEVALREFLTRARVAKGGPVGVSVAIDSDTRGWMDATRAAVRACRDAGYEPDRVYVIGDPANTRPGAPTDPLQFLVRPAQPAVAAAGSPAPDAAVRRVAVGGTIHVTPGAGTKPIRSVSSTRDDVIEVNTDKDGRGVTIRGLKAGLADVAVAIEGGHVHTVRVSVVDAVDPTRP